MGHTVRFEWELPETLLAIVAKDQSAIADEVKQAAVLDWVRYTHLRTEHLVAKLDRALL